MEDLDLPARLLHRDASVLILNKPAGLPVHAGPKGGPTLMDGLEALRFGLPRLPELAHRLDKDTSGCLVLGRHPRALADLGALFAQGRVEKTYWAVVKGGPAPEEGRIDMPLAKRSPQRGWWMKPDPKGQTAITDFRVLGRGDGLAWLELKPQTGRTHQLRVHCAASGFPILGDTVYGDEPRFSGETLHLHARAVIVPFHKNKPPISGVAPPPPHMIARLESLGWRPD